MKKKRPSHNQVLKIQKERGGRTHIINSQIVNYQVLNFQRMPGKCRQMMFRQPTQKSRKNANNFFLDFKTNSKVLIHTNLKNSQHHYHIAKITFQNPYIAKIIFQNLHIAKINTKPHLPHKWSPTQAWKAPLGELGHEMHQSSIGHATPVIILDLFNFSQAPQVAQIHSTA